MHSLDQSVKKFGFSGLLYPTYDPHQSGSQYVLALARVVRFARGAVEGLARLASRACPCRLTVCVGSVLSE